MSHKSWKQTTGHPVQCVVKLGHVYPSEPMVPEDLKCDVRFPSPKPYAWLSLGRVDHEVISRLILLCRGVEGAGCSNFDLTPMGIPTNRMTLLKSSEARLARS